MTTQTPTAPASEDECKLCGGDDMIPIRERRVNCDCGGRDGGDCVMCKGKGHYSVIQMADCPECFPH